MAAGQSLKLSKCQSQSGSDATSQTDGAGSRTLRSSSSSRSSSCTSRKTPTAT
jgi:hypothetical protein